MGRARGKLEFPITISQIEQFIFQVETYAAGSMVQNMRLAAESMGLGNWIFCGYFDDMLMGAFPDVAKGLEFRARAAQREAPAASRRAEDLRGRGVKEGTYVPSPALQGRRAVVTR